MPPETVPPTEPDAVTVTAATDDRFCVCGAERGHYGSERCKPKPTVTDSAAAQRHTTSVWRDEYGEWVWSCTCSPDLHGGYATAGRAGQEAEWHEEAPDGT